MFSDTRNGTNFPILRSIGGESYDNLETEQTFSHTIALDYNF
jgi:hypothetical protein